MTLQSFIAMIACAINERQQKAKYQEAEALIACNILNAMTTLGRPEPFAIDT
jgi:hypothetical protein